MKAGRRRAILAASLFSTGPLKSVRPQDLGIGSLFEKIQDAVIVADAETQEIVLWNSAATNIFGYSTSEALGLRVEALIPEYLKNRHRAGMARYAETGHGPYIDSQKSLELPALRKDGEEIYVELSLSATGRASGSGKDYVMAMVRDITERKRAEEEVEQLNEELENRVMERTAQLAVALVTLEERERVLRESEERHQSFIERSTEGIWRLELKEPVATSLPPDEQVEHFYRHGYLAECNDAAARMYGYAKAEEIVGVRLGELLPRSVKENIEYLEAFISSDYRLSDAESQEIDRYGHTKYFLNNLTGSVEDGSLVRAWGTQRDITERKQIEEQLRSSRDQLEIILQGVADGITVQDPSGRLIYANGAAARIIGYPSAQALLGAPLQEVMQKFEVLDEQGRPFPLDRLPGRLTLEGEEHPETLLRFRSAETGEERCSLVKARPVFDEEGRVRLAISIFTDITARRRAEEELRRSEDRLRLAVESTRLGTWDFSPVTGELRWDARCKAMFGLSPEAEVDYEVFLAGLHPEDRERTHQVVQHALDPASRGEFDIEYRTVSLQDGTERWVVARGQAVFDEAGRAVRFIGTVLDITGRKQAEQELRTRQRQQAAIAGLGIRALEGMKLFALMDEAVALVARTLKVEYCKLLELLPQGNQLLLRAGVGWKEGLVGHAIVGTDLESQASYTLAAKEPVIVEDLSTESRFSGPSLLHEHGVVSGMSVVIHGRDGPLGVLGAHTKSRRTFTEDDVNFLQAVANVLATAVERKRAEDAQRFLAATGTALSSSLDYRATLASVAQLAVPYLADWCAVDILDEDSSLDRLAVAHQDPEKVALAHEILEHYPDASYGVAQVLRTGRSMLGPEISESRLMESARSAEHRELLRKLGPKSYIIVPLVARGRTLGAITLVSAESGRRYGHSDLELAEELARRAALAVDNARLYRGRSEVAHTLQQGLLPSRLPQVPGVEVGLRYLSVGEVDVGGDFYDLFHTELIDQGASSWGVVIGDVSGKGAEAAALLAFARYTIRAVAMHESRPSAILTGLNKTMLRQKRERNDHRFCTVAYVRLDTEESRGSGARITVSRGGHSTPLLLKADGSIRTIGQPGRAIGVFDDANLTEQEARLAPGDALVLYTDGVIEARSPAGIFFGEERLLTLLRSSVALDASTIASRIEDAVLGFQEQAPRDDVAVLVLRISD